MHQGICDNMVTHSFTGMHFIGRPRKAGPPPERKLEGSIDVIGGEGSRGNYNIQSE